MADPRRQRDRGPRRTPSRAASSATRTRSTTCQSRSSTTATATGSCRLARCEGGGGERPNAAHPGRTFETLPNDLVGGVYFSFAKYRIQVAQQPALTHGRRPVDERAAARPRPRRGTPWRLQRREPLRLPGRPERRLRLHRQRRLPRREPTVRLRAGQRSRLPGPPRRDRAADRRGPARAGHPARQEAEDQDICAVTAGALDCGTTDNAGREARTRCRSSRSAIAAQRRAAYDAAYDRDGADDRGIVSGFLYRSDRVQLLPASARRSGARLVARPCVRARGLAYNTQVQNPKALNADLPTDIDTLAPARRERRLHARAAGRTLPDLADGGRRRRARSTCTQSPNHFSTPDGRVGQRREQARVQRARSWTRSASSPTERVVVGGDFNVYPGRTIPSRQPCAIPSDQLGAAVHQGRSTTCSTCSSPSRRAAAYSYVFKGQTQTLDQFVTADSSGELERCRAAHVNADLPADRPATARGADPTTIRWSRATSSCSAVTTTTTMDDDDDGDDD